MIAFLINLHIQDSLERCFQNGRLAPESTNVISKYSSIGQNTGIVEMWIAKLNKMNVELVYHMMGSTL
jgi:hypothetical protein